MNDIVHQTLIDLHCHTARHSHDGHARAEDIVSLAASLGLAGIAFTDHNYCWPPEELDELLISVGLKGKFRLWSGQEVRVHSDIGPLGDLLVYGVQRPLPDGTPIQVVLDSANEARGFVIAAHPGLPGKGLGERLADFPITASEQWNGRYGAKQARVAEELLAHLPLPRTGGSDAHEMSQVGSGATAFDVPCGEIVALADIHRLIVAGRCRPWRPASSDRMKQWWRSLQP